MSARRPLPKYLDDAIEEYRRSQGCGCCGADPERKLELREALDEAIREYARHRVARGRG